MKNIAIALLFLCASAGFATADSNLVVLESQHSVKETLDRLSATLTKNGATIFARVDHAKGAAAVDTPIPPSEVLIFGNPKLGTPLMLSNRRIGLDLPLKVLAWEDDRGKTWLAYTKPDILKQRYGIEDKDKVFTTIGKVLGKVTGAAAAE